MPRNSDQFLSALRAGVPSPEGNPKIKSLYGITPVTLGTLPVAMYGVDGNQRAVPVAPWGSMRLTILVDQGGLLNLSWLDGRGNLMPPKARAVDTLTIGPGLPANGETFNLGGKVYTVEAALTNVNGNIQIGADEAEMAYNIIQAVILGAGVGTRYATAMTLNPQATAEAGAAVDEVLATAKYGGVSGNAIVSTEALANCVWANAGTLLGGVDGLITVDETTIVADTPLQLDIPGYTDAAPEHLGEPYLEVAVSGLAAAGNVTIFDCMGASW